MYTLFLFMVAPFLCLNPKPFLQSTPYLFTTSLKYVVVFAFTPNVKWVLSENLGGILGGTQCEMGDCLISSEC